MIPTLFVHVPKTGGSTFIMEYKARYGKGNVVNYDKSLALNPDHLDKPFVTSHVPWSYLESLANGRYVFTLLRDPVERVKSWIRFKAGHSTKQGNAAASMKPRDFIESGVGQNVFMQTHERMVRHFGGDYWEPYDESVMPAVLDRACDVLSRMDWVGFTETWSDNQVLLCERIGMKDPFSGSVLNVSKGDVKFSDADIEAILEATRWDRKFYDHAWGVYGERQP